MEFTLVGIPMIFAGIILLFFTKWIWGAGLFAAGWVFLFLGHRIEGNHPAFFQGPVYLLVGPIWVAKEAWMFLSGRHPMPESESPQASDPSAFMAILATMLSGSLIPS